MKLSVMQYGHRLVPEGWTRWCAEKSLCIAHIARHSLLQIQTPKGELIITNDGATILKSIQALHPAAKMVRDF